MAPRRNRLRIPQGRHRAKRYATKGVGYFFPEGVGLFVELPEVVEFGEVFDCYNYVIAHDYFVIFIRQDLQDIQPRLNGLRNLTG